MKVKPLPKDWYTELNVTISQKFNGNNGKPVWNSAQNPHGENGVYILW